MPAYQSAEFIQETLDSLSSQTVDDFKIFISVDLCEDETYDICLKQSLKDPRFTVTKQDKRLGYVGNCNFLLDQANAKYVLFAFHDDILDAKYVEKLCAVLDKQSEVIMTYSDILRSTVDGKTSHLKYRRLDGIKNRVLRGLNILRLKGNWSIPNRGVFRLDEARKIRGLKSHEAGDYSTDWPWLFHMSLLGQFQRVPETLCHKYYKKTSLSKTWDHNFEQRLGATKACMRELRISPLSIFEKFLLSIPIIIGLFRLKCSIKLQTFKS